MFYTLFKILGNRKKVRVNVDKAVQPELEKALSYKAVTNSQVDTSNLKWRPLKPLKFDLLPVKPIEPDCLPRSLYDYAENNSSRIDQSPIEYVVIGLLVSLSALLGCGVGIRPKRYDLIWIEYCNLWAIITGRPSDMKTPCLKAGSAPLKHLQKTSKNNEFDFDLNDATYEAACIKAQANPKGILLFRDEISAWLNSLERSEKALERAFYLEGFSVNPYLQDRVTRDPVLLKKLTISILGGIQPTKLLQILRSRANGSNDDGLFERFQLLVFPDTAGKYRDIAPDLDVAKKVERIFILLSKIGNPEIPLELKFEESAQKIWDDWASRFKDDSNNCDEEEQSVLGKYPALCAKLSMLFHLVSEAEKHGESVDFKPKLEVSKESIIMALKWLDILWSHNRRIQHFSQNHSHSDKASLLLKRLKMVKNEPFSLRDVYRGGMTGMKTAEHANQGAQELIARGYLQSVTQKSANNKVKTMFYRHPDLLKPIKF